MHGSDVALAVITLLAFLCLFLAAALTGDPAETSGDTDADADA